ncbi:MAG: glycosylasparaginase [Sphingobacteriales bacterium]|nr:MAG: glycosylasparaginase [Sphingobacteriales bacterium]
MKRRQFLQSIPAIAPIIHLQTPTANPQPVIISTWDFGKKANNVSWTTLQQGGSALDAVEKGINLIEEDPDNLTVGIGGLPDREGHVTLDACIMDQDSRCGSVMGVEHIVNVISLARRVMEKTPHVILVGDGALQFAMDQGFKKINLLTPKSEALWKEWLKTSNYQPRMNIENELFKKDPMPGGKDNHDTIGLIAMDAKGNIAGGCSTSGMAYKMRGRVGDSPVIGAGLFVDNEIGAATSTGVGEEVIRCVGSHLVVELMRHGYTPENACKEAVMRIVRKSPAKSKEIQVGFLALNKKGEYGAYALQKGFSFAVKTANQDIVIPGKSYYP